MIGNDYSIMIDRWLQHPEYGLQAMLGQVPLRPGMGRVGEVLVRNDVEDKDCIFELRPKGGSQYLVVASETDSMPDKGKRAGKVEANDAVAIGLYYLAAIGDQRRAIACAEIVIEAAFTSLSLLCDKGFVDKIEPPADRDSWRDYGNVHLVKMVESTAHRLRATAQSNDAVAYAVLLARLHGMRTTFTPAGVA